MRRLSSYKINFAFGRTYTRHNTCSMGSPCFCTLNNPDIRPRRGLFCTRSRQFPRHSRNIHRFHNFLALFYLSIFANPSTASGPPPFAQGRQAHVSQFFGIAYLLKLREEKFSSRFIFQIFHIRKALHPFGLKKRVRQGAPEESKSKAYLGVRQGAFVEQRSITTLI